CSASFLSRISQKPNYLIQNLALMMVLNTKNYGDKISLCYISRRRFKTLLWGHLKDKKLRRICLRK
ncbi:unnamed protein product, partial [Brassica napus]